MSLINGIFSGYYDLLVLALIVLVPIWFGRFVIEAAALLLRQRRHD